MRRYVFAVRLAFATLLVALLTSAPVLSPALALTTAQKMATCKFGADDQKLAGAARTAFIKKCMVNKDEPRASGTVPAAAPAAAAPRQ